MIRVGAGTQHKKEKKKQPPKIPLEYIVRPKFLECIRLRKKTPKSFPLDTHYTSKKTKEMVKITKSTRSLFLSCGSFSLLLSLSFVPTMLRFLRVRVFFLSLSFRAAFVCARLCVSRAASDLRLGVLFPSQPQVFFSCAHVLTFPLFIITSSFHSVCCIGAGYVGGPTMAMIALKCPHIEVIL